MGVLTGLLYACLGVFAAGWYFNKWTGNFSLAAVHPHGRHLRLLAGRALLLRAAPPCAPSPTSSSRTRRAASSSPARASRASTTTSPETRQALLMQPWWLDWTAGLFPVILVVFLLRSFLFEPFKIPSGSMMPTLLVGDLILVNKFHYGIRLPVINKKIVQNHDPRARRRDGVPLSRRIRAPTTSSASSACPATRSCSTTSSSSSTASWPRSSRCRRRGSTTRKHGVTQPEFTEKLGNVEHGILINPQSTPVSEARTAINFRSARTAATVPTGWPARCRPATIS